MLTSTPIMYVFFLVVSTGSTTAPYGVVSSPSSYPSGFSFPYTASANSTFSPVTGSICSSPAPSSMISSESLSSCFDSFMRTGAPSKSLSANLSVTLLKSIIVKYCFPYSSLIRVPRPIICLNSVMEPVFSSRQITLQVCASVPVLISFEVVAITGNFCSGFMKSSRYPLATGSSPVMRTIYLSERAVISSGAYFRRACLIRSACSISTQKTIVFAIGSEFVRYSIIFLATRSVRSSITILRSKSFVL